MKIQLRKHTSRPMMVSFIGDIAPGYPTYKPINKSRRLLDHLGGCDLVVANVETPLTNATSLKKWGSSLSSDPASVRELKELNVNVANLANNHIIDQGPHGLEETLRVLTQNGIPWLGAGRNINRASRPLLCKKTARKIVFLAYSFETLCYPSLASVNAPGANPLILNDAKRHICSLRERGYLVCTSYHGGDEFFRIPCPKYRAVLKELVQAGAHLVIGHHAHLFQGIEIFNGSVIAYGLGNFYMNTKFQKKHRGTDIGLLLTVELDHMGPFAYSIDFVHNQRSLRKLSLLQGQKKAQLLKLLNHISTVLADKGEYVREWRRDCCRLVLGMNTASVDPLYLKKVYGYRKLFASVVAFIRERKSTEYQLQYRPNRPNSSILDIIFAAIIGLFISKSYYRNLRKVYKAYEIE